MKSMWKTAVLVSVLTVVGGLSAAAQAKDVLQIEGSTTVGPIADAFAEVFMKDPTISITVKKTGSGDGIAALIDGRCQIATSSRSMKPEEFKKAVEKGVCPVTHLVALDGVCVIVHPSNPVQDLKKDQLSAIYTGKVTNWKEVGGPDKPIVVITRDSSSGTFEVFKEKILGKDKMTDKAETVNANPQMFNRVKTTEDAIGYVGIGFTEGEVKAVKVNGVSASKKTVVNGEYLISRPLFLFTNGYPEMGSVIYKYCTYGLTEKGQETIEAKGFVPVTNY
jgi:phosphate transport system substrate-binding protein